MTDSTLDKPRASVVAGLQIDPERSHSDQPVENAVLGLIGPSAKLDAGALAHVRSTPHADGETGAEADIAQLLHSQYWQALLNPRAPAAQPWDRTQTNDSSVYADDATADRPSTNAGTSIETLISGERTLDEVFGPLSTQGSNQTEFALEPAPEILRLFAPAAYQASLARGPASLPPELTRREHQVLTVDSPLNAPELLGPHQTP
ncbi:TagK domain-containing protein [Ralstonia sp. UBA689]|uniref:TagK domain-containing protein n=1 Tax=Ralstonia sp. UBA689 TaxID=1947373 RepID=UPI0025EA8612|nr:TagK domain-containing protein [Ralstonia sp. UBA689]